MAKPELTPRGLEQRHMNEYMLGHQRGQAKWLTGVLVQPRLEFCTFAKRLFYEKAHILNQLIAALRRSVGLLGRFVTVWKKANRTHKHTQLL